MSIVNFLDLIPKDQTVRICNAVRLEVLYEGPASEAENVTGDVMAMGAILFRVSHPDYPTIEVAAIDRVRAVTAAAQAWGVMRWTSIARSCTVEELGPAPEPEHRERRRVLKIRQDGTVVKKYGSARAAAKDNYMSTQCVIDRCNGKIKRPFGSDGCTFVFEG